MGLSASRSGPVPYRTRRNPHSRAPADSLAGISEVLPWLDLRSRRTRLR